MDLRTVLREALKELDETRPLSPGKVVRASGFAEVCPREEVLIAETSLVRTRARDADNLLTLALGHGMHYALQNHVLPRVGVLYGVWRCQHCAVLVGAPPEAEPFRVEEGVPPVSLETFLTLRPLQCPSCGSPDRCPRCARASDPCLSCQEKGWQYKELHFESVEYGIGGHPDGFLRLDGMPGLGLLEIKSTGRPFEVRQAPYVAHAIQVQIYLWFTGLQWAKVLYWSKGDWGMKALIEHTIHRDEETLRSIQDALASLWTGLEGGPLPRRICAVETAPRAVTCACARACFARPDAPEPEPSPEPAEDFEGPPPLDEHLAGDIF